MQNDGHLMIALNYLLADRASDLVYADALDLARSLATGKRFGNIFSALMRNEIDPVALGTIL